MTDIVTTPSSPTVKSDASADSAAAMHDEPAVRDATPLLTAAKYLFLDSQRSRSETTDDGISPYMIQRKHFYQPQQWDKVVEQLTKTATLYIGNLSFYTNEEQLFEYFGYGGRVRQIRMGLNQLTMTPCGFAFVLYTDHNAALACQRNLSGTMLDERTIRADLDVGFEEGRQFGRSKLTGGQTRDDHRQYFDPGRGGYVVTQVNTFAEFKKPRHSQGPTGRRSSGRKRQRIDLAAVRAARSETNISDTISEYFDGQPKPATDDKVGSKRRRDDGDDNGIHDYDDYGDDEQPNDETSDDMAVKVDQDVELSAADDSAPQSSATVS